MDEEVIAAVPSERARYTAMGGVALYSVFGEVNPIAFGFVPVWGLFILFLDRWLMASTSTRAAGERFRKLFPRFLLATVFGVIIAEPLLLGIFHTAIDQRIRDDRAAAILQQESDLRRCNPVPGTPEAASGAAAAANCADFRLGVTTDSEAKQQELDQAIRQRDTLKTTVDADAKAYADLEQKAREECNGTPGPGFTGKVGQGPNCHRLRDEADQYRRDHRIDENNQKLAALNDTIAQLTGQVGTSRSTTASRIDHDIQENGYVLAAEWALRFFFIVVDSLPVLLKFMSGFTAYDALLANRVQGQDRAARVANETVRRDAVLREELARHQLVAEHAAARNKVEFDARLRHIDVDVLREDLIDRRAAYLLGDSATIPLVRVPDQDDPEGGTDGLER
ncbi:MAG: hypothetical protein AUG44_09940 [Actinobacteria bacterium 13_1_20CM_3_71_11]|nr:MAG: hypothetical protein AUG44_09940 [Actinobacteria bacterium 13_1_20CM_3_71_11]